MPFGAVWLLDFIGIKYQMLFIDADQIDDFADAVRGFAQRVAETTDEGSKIVSDLANVWEGHSFRAFVASWTQLNDTNMTELQEVCELVAGALEAAAVMVRVVQAAVVAELAALAATFVATQIAGLATMGAATPLGLVVAAAAKRLLSEMQQVLLAYLLFEVLARAIEPFEDTIGRIVNGFGSGVMADHPDVNEMRMDHPTLERAANMFDYLAEQMKGHGEWLGEQVGHLFQDDGIGFDDHSSRVAPVNEPPALVADASQNYKYDRAPETPAFATARDSDVDALLARLDENINTVPSAEPAPLPAASEMQTPFVASRYSNAADLPAASEGHDAGRGGRAGGPDAEATTALTAADMPWLRTDPVPNAFVAPDIALEATAGLVVPASWTDREEGAAPRDAREGAATPLSPKARRDKEGETRTPTRTPWTGRPSRSVAAANLDPDRSLGPVRTPWSRERGPDRDRRTSAAKTNARRRNHPASAAGQSPPATADTGRPPVEVIPPRNDRTLRPDSP